MAKAKYLKDGNGNNFYPVAHAGATYTKTGETVQSVLDKLKPINKSDYDALGDATKTDNVIYFVLNGNGTEGEILRNRISYGGGSLGENGIELTTAEYNKLDEENKVLSNINYYLKDYATDSSQIKIEIDSTTNNWKIDGVDTGITAQGGGVTFTPSIDSNCNLSWSNDGGKPNPPTVNIRGRDGNSGGVTTPLSGFFTMYVDSDSNLWALSESDMSDCFEYDSNTGDLYFITEREDV